MDSASPNPDTTTPTPEATMAGRTTSPTHDDNNPDPPGTGLRPTQRRYAELRVLGIAKEKAYAEAYPKASPQTARRESANLERNPRVLRYLSHLRATGFESAELSVADLTKALKRIAFFDYSTICDEGGELLPVALWPKGAGLVIQGVTAKTANSNGTAKIPERIAALRTLAEMRGALGQGVGSRENQPKASFVFNFGVGKSGKPKPKVVHGEVLVDQDDVANVLPAPARMIDTERDTSEVET